MKWSHVALNRRDIDTTARWYRDLFGFRTARVVRVGDDRIVFLRCGDAYLELFAAKGEAAPASADGPAEAGRARHLAFQVDDVDQFTAGPGAEAPVSLGPLSFDDYIPGWRTVWIRDPDGVVVEVSQGYVDDPTAGALDD